MTNHTLSLNIGIQFEGFDELFEYLYVRTRTISSRRFLDFFFQEQEKKLGDYITTFYKIVDAKRYVAIIIQIIYLVYDVFVFYSTIEHNYYVCNLQNKNR